MSRPFRITYSGANGPLYCSTFDAWDTTTWGSLSGWLGGPVPNVIGDPRPCDADRTLRLTWNPPSGRQGQWYTSEDGCQVAMLEFKEDKETHNE